MNLAEKLKAKSESRRKQVRLDYINDDVILRPMNTRDIVDLTAMTQGLTDEDANSQKAYLDAQVEMIFRCLINDDGTQALNQKDELYNLPLVDLSSLFDEITSLSGLDDDSQAELKKSSEPKDRSKES